MYNCAKTNEQGRGARLIVVQQWRALN